MILLSNCREHFEQKKSMRLIMVFFYYFFFTPFSLMIYIELRLSTCLLKIEHASIFVLKACMILCFVCFEIALNLPRGLVFIKSAFIRSLYRSRNLSLRYRYIARGKGPGIWGFRKEVRKRNRQSITVMYTTKKNPPN